MRGNSHAAVHSSERAPLFFRPLKLSHITPCRLDTSVRRYHSSFSVSSLSINSVVNEITVQCTFVHSHGVRAQCFAIASNGIGQFSRPRSRSLANETGKPLNFPKPRVLECLGIRLHHQPHTFKLRDAIDPRTMH
jgi:hypothetical protein